MSFEADFYEGENFHILNGEQFSATFWPITGANASIYQHLWLAPQEPFLSAYPGFPTLALSGFGVTLANDDTNVPRIMQTVTIANNLDNDANPLGFVPYAVSIIVIPSQD